MSIELKEGVCGPRVGKYLNKTRTRTKCLTMSERELNTYTIPEGESNIYTTSIQKLDIRGSLRPIPPKYERTLYS